MAAANHVNDGFMESSLTFAGRTDKPDLHPGHGLTA